MPNDMNVTPFANSEIRSLRVGSNGQFAGRPDEPSHGSKCVETRPTSQAAPDIPAQRPVQSFIPSREEAQYAAEVALKYYQNNLGSISSSELNDLYQIKQHFQSPG
ncbi:uncharacterized protein N7469_001954 [Penicillium citrinum]|uniref:Uncharacterized protein n=1 Tax=Penicillium citrinum TaxID=5077 RepID=A0A9W9P9H5_PENCI|nr:uncharacterized protein N7469_001954 [Penicillium citrinum]KAJ5240363.1 hypothetical protein N7469_001954 [Penicillium citrinum]